MTFHRSGSAQRLAASHALLGWASMGMRPLTALLPGLASLLSWSAGVR